MANLPIPASGDSVLPSGTKSYTPQWRFIVSGSYILPYQLVNGKYQYMPTQEAIRAYFGALIGGNTWTGDQVFTGNLIDSNGNLYLKVTPPRNITAATTILATDYTINIISGTFPQPLPATTLASGQILNIHNRGTGIITVTGTDIDGQNSVLLQQGDNLQVQYTGVSGTYLIL